MSGYVTSRQECDLPAIGGRDLCRLGGGAVKFGGQRRIVGTALKRRGERGGGPVAVEGTTGSEEGA